MVGRGRPFFEIPGGPTPSGRTRRGWLSGSSSGKATTKNCKSRIPGLEAQAQDRLWPHRYQSKGDPADWTAAAKALLATEKPDAIVIMLGLDDHVAMREPAVDKSDSKSSDKKTDKDTKAKLDAKPSDGKPGAKPGGGTDATAKMTSRSIPNCRRRTPPIMMGHRPSRRRRARAR